jgi:hypothetical protein
LSIAISEFLPICLEFFPRLDGTGAR